MCWGRHTCHMGAVKALKALAEIPPERRPPAVRRTIAAGAEYLLRHHVHKRSHDLTRVSKPSWRRLSFPLMWQTDVLEILLHPGRGWAYCDERLRRSARDPSPPAPDAQCRWRLQADLQRQVPRPHRGQGPAEPLDHAARAPGAGGSLDVGLTG